MGLKPKLIALCMQQAAAAVAGAEGSLSESECYGDGLASLVLLCHRVVLGVTAAPWQQDSSPAGCTAGKRQVALLNSCLKLLNRLAAQPNSTQRGSGTQEELSDHGSCYTGSNSSSRSAAVKWVACQAAAAIAAFGITLTHRPGNDINGSSSKLADAGWSLAARGLLFVSRHMAEGCRCREPHALKRRLLASISSSCLQLQAKVSALPSPERRTSIPTLKDQARGLSGGLGRMPADRLVLVGLVWGGVQWPLCCQLPAAPFCSWLMLDRWTRQCLQGKKVFACYLWLVRKT